MEVRPFTKGEREDLLRRYDEAMVEYNAAMDRDDQVRANHYLPIATALERLYFEKLPRPVVSCCPYDGKPLLRTFDPFGFDGPWWTAAAPPAEIPTCTHFCVLVGAVNYQGRDPVGGDEEVRPGPEVPYVIPRLLEYEGMIAVISTLRMEPGYVAYPIAYFAERRPPVEKLTAGWGRSLYSYKDAFGESGWREVTDAWDFDLRPWLDRGKIRWCAPHSDNRTLSEDAPENCPYLDLPGEKQQIVVSGRHFWTAGVPGGS